MFRFNASGCVQGPLTSPFEYGNKTFIFIKAEHSLINLASISFSGNSWWCYLVTFTGSKTRMRNSRGMLELWSSIYELAGGGGGRDCVCADCTVCWMLCGIGCTMPTWGGDMGGEGWETCCWVWWGSVWECMCAEGGIGKVLYPAPLSPRRGCPNG